MPRQNVPPVTGLNAGFPTSSSHECLKIAAGCCFLSPLAERARWLGFKYEKKGPVSKIVEQPGPFTPDFAWSMVREHAYRLYRDKLQHHRLTLEDWMLAEKDLVAAMEAEEDGVVV